MSATTSASSGRRYGIHRVCRVWERTRSCALSRGGLVRKRRDSGRAPGSPFLPAPCYLSDQQNCWRPFAPTSLGSRSRARAIA